MPTDGYMVGAHLLQDDARRDFFADAEASLSPVGLADDRRSAARFPVLPETVERQVRRCDRGGRIDDGSARPAS